MCELLFHTEAWTRVKGSSEHFQINYHRVVHDGKRAGGWGGGDLQNVWLWGGELPRLKDSDHQKNAAGQRGKGDSGGRLRLSGGLGSFIGWQDMKCCSDPTMVSLILLDAADCL